MEKFLIIQTAFIGDAILTLPMIQKLKELNPDCLIDVITIPQTAVIFSHSPSVNSIHIFDKKGKHKSLYHLYKFAGFLKKGNYSRIYAPHRSFRTSLLVMFTGVKETYGFNFNSMRHIYKHLTDYQNARHEVERNLHLINFPAEREGWRILPGIKLPSETVDKIENFFSVSGDNGDFAAIAPGSVWNTKIYPPEYTEQVISFLVTKFRRVFLIGGDNDRKICEELESKFPETVKSVAGMFNLIESVAFLKKMKILVTNDSAPSHLGMCADIPVLMIYCSTVPDFGFYPYNKKSYFLSYNDLACKPCGIHGFERCPLKHFECGYKLKPETVINKIEEMINA